MRRYILKFCSQVKIYSYALAASSVFLLLMGLQNAATHANAQRITAPLADPSVAVYLRLKEGFAQLSADSASAPKTIFANAFLNASAARAHIRERAEGEKQVVKAADPSKVLEHILTFCTSVRFMPEDLFIYVRTPDEYVALLTGSVIPALWEPFFRKDSIIRRGDGFSVNALESKDTPDTILHIGKGFLFICPNAIEGNILDALQNETVLDGKRWKTFTQMVNLQPVLALEADFNKLLETADKLKFQSLNLPFPWNRVCTLRCLIDRRVIKAQMHAPDDGARPLVFQAVSSLVEILKNTARETIFHSFGASAAGTIQNTSVFLEGPGLENNTAPAETAVIGIMANILSSAIQ